MPFMLPGSSQSHVRVMLLWAPSQALPQALVLLPAGPHLETHNDRGLTGLVDRDQRKEMPYHRPERIGREDGHEVPGRGQRAELTHLACGHVRSAPFGHSPTGCA